MTVVSADRLSEYRYVTWNIAEPHVYQQPLNEYCCVCLFFGRANFFFLSLERGLLMIVARLLRGNFRIMEARKLDLGDYWLHPFVCLCVCVYMAAVLFSPHRIIITISAIISRECFIIEIMLVPKNGIYRHTLTAKYTHRAAVRSIHV